MFSIGEYVVYGVEGVCRVEEAGKLKVAGLDKNRAYYRLRPYYHDGTIYTPVDGKAVMRPVLTREELERVHEICKRHGVIVASDEIHFDLLPHGAHTVYAKVDPDAVVLTAPSKTFNVPGLQLSNAIVKNAARREAFRADLRRVRWLPRSKAQAVLLMLRCGLYPLARRAILIRRRQNQQACVSAESAI